MATPNRFAPLGSSGQLLIYRPHVEKSIKDECDIKHAGPRVILLFGFYNAPASYIEKNFLSKYVELYPASIVIFVRAGISWVFDSLQAKERALEPLLRVVLYEVYDAPATGNGLRPGFLVHVMSSGGGFLFCTFARMLEKCLQRRPASPVSPLPLAPIPQAIVFDSVPSRNELVFVRALFAHVRSPILRAAGVVPAAAILLATAAFYTVAGRPFPFTSLHKRLERADPIVGADSFTPRLYIYSEDDDQTYYGHVEDHLKIARSKAGSEGVIGVEKFVGSGGHVRHVVADPERYWRAVTKSWEQALKRSGEVKGGQATQIKGKL